MKKIIFTLCVLKCSMPSFGVPVSDYTDGISSFASDLYQKCAEESINKNIIISPLSVSNALALLSQGAQSNTFEQIARGLHLNNDKSAIATDFAKHYKTLNERAGGAALLIANQLYVKQGYQIKKEFRDSAESQFESGIESLNFAESVPAAAVINSFVEKKTNNKITNLIQPDSLGADTRLVLINAVHFKGEWLQKFKEYRTSSDNFYTDETNTIPVDFMHEDDDFNYAQLNDLHASALELKYENSNFSFVIVLPNSRNGLSALETALRNYNLSKITSQFKEEYVDVTIPKFKIEYEIGLNDALQKLGMVEMFGDNADLGGILDSPEPLKVSKAIHKAFIEVNEDGTEAAAATGVFAVTYSGRIRLTEKKIFKADHPFLFYILDAGQNTILFSGRYVN